MNNFRIYYKVLVKKDETSIYGSKQGEIIKAMIEISEIEIKISIEIKY